METIKETLFISEKSGSIQTLTYLPGEAKYYMILGHGAGAGMHHHFMEHLAITLADHQIVTTRYNFPYMEKGTGRPDTPAVTEVTILKVLEYHYERFSTERIVLAGKSFGGRMSSMALANNPSPGVIALVFYGFPLHPPGKPSVERAAHLTKVAVPMLFLQGERDTLAEKDLIASVTSGLPKAKLIMYEGADHSFKRSKRAKEIFRDLAVDTLSFLEQSALDFG